ALCEPALGLLDIEFDPVRIVLRQQGIEIAQPFDETAVARIAAIRHHDVIDGPLLGAGTGHPDLQRHLASFLGAINCVGKLISFCRSPESRRDPVILVPWGHRAPASYPVNGEIAGGAPSFRSGAGACWRGCPADRRAFFRRALPPPRGLACWCPSRARWRGLRADHAWRRPWPSSCRTCPGASSGACSFPQPWCRTTPRCASCASP